MSRFPVRGAVFFSWEGPPYSDWSSSSCNFFTRNVSPNPPGGRGTKEGPQRYVCFYQGRRGKARPFISRPAKNAHSLFLSRARRFTDFFREARAYYVNSSNYHQNHVIPTDKRRRHTSSTRIADPSRAKCCWAWAWIWSGLRERTSVPMAFQLPRPCISRPRRNPSCSSSAHAPVLNSVLVLLILCCRTHRAEVEDERQKTRRPATNIPSVREV